MTKLVVFVQFEQRLHIWCVSEVAHAYMNDVPTMSSDKFQTTVFVRVVEVSKRVRTYATYHVYICSNV